MESLDTRLLSNRDDQDSSQPVYSHSWQVRTVHGVAFSDTHNCSSVQGFMDTRKSLPTVHTWAGTVQDYTYTADTAQQQT